MTLSDKLSKWIATMFGIGYLPKAPGTWGSAVAIIIVGFFKYYLELYTPEHARLFYISFWFITAFLAFYAIKVYEYSYETHDSSEIVIDEWVGQSFPLIFFTSTWAHCILAFILFRIFDIKKMGLVKWADEDLHGASGTLLDDIFAGMMATIVLGVLIISMNI